MKQTKNTGRAHLTSATTTDNTTETLERADGNITYRQQADGTITIRLAGAIADTLRRAARTMNGVDWCDNDNTALTLLDYFFMPTLDELGDADNIGEAVYQICAGIDAGAEGEERKRRISRLREALEREFVI